jgi:hypothetical protein
MSQKEHNRTGLQILVQQLTHHVFPDPDNPQTADEFINKFEGILGAIHAITKDDYSAGVKKTMLRAQLRGEAALRFGWHRGAVETGSYQQLKEAMRKEYPGKH